MVQNIPLPVLSQYLIWKRTGISTNKWVLISIAKSKCDMEIYEVQATQCV